MRRFFIHILCLILVQGQIALANPNGSKPKGSVPKIPANGTSSSPLSVESITGVKGPSGNIVDAYVVQGMAPTADGHKRVWAFDKDGNSVKGVLVDSEKKLIQWEGQKLEASQDRMRPSAVIKYTSWDENKRKRMSDLTRRLKAGDTSLLQEIQTETAKELEANKPQHKKMGGMANIGVAFYFALGVLAFVELSTNYANQPNAWTDFADSLTDPISWLMLPAFILASQRVFQWAATFKGWKSFAASSGAMTVGIIATTVLGKMLYDPNLRQCLGFQSYDEHGRYKRDEEACSELYDAWSGEELFMTIVPVIGHAVMAGGIVAALRWFVGTGLNAFELGKKLKMSAQVAGRAGGKSGSVISIATGIGSMLLFFGAFKISYMIVDLESSLRNFFLTTFNPFPDPSGSAIPSNLRLLSETFTKESQAGFKEKIQINDLGSVCEAIHASARHKLDSARCHGTNFEAAVDKHLELMSKWRQYLFKKVNTAYSAWSTRSDGYHRNAIAAYRTYSALTQDIALHRAGTLDMNSRLYQEGEDGDGRRFTFNQLEILKNSSFAVEGQFKYVETGDFFDFFVTSMACGPAPQERTGQLSFIENAQTYISSPATPEIMLYNQDGEKAVFYPPRLVPEGELNICSKPPQKLYGVGKYLSFLPNPSELVLTPTLVPSYVWGWYGDQKFSGIIDYLTKAVPQELTTEEGFNDWWSTHVLKQFETVNNEIADDYAEFLNTTYKRVLSISHSKCWNIQGAESLGGSSALIREAGIVTECADNTQMRLGYGLTSSVVEQAAFYDNLILKIMDQQRLDVLRLRPLIVERLKKLQAVSQIISITEEPKNFYDAVIKASDDYGIANDAVIAEIKNIVGTQALGTDRSRFLIDKLSRATESAAAEAIYFLHVLNAQDVTTNTSF